jgi:hypothetical protein
VCGRTGVKIFFVNGEFPKAEIEIAGKNQQPGPLLLSANRKRQTWLQVTPIRGRVLELHFLSQGLCTARWPWYLHFSNPPFSSSAMTLSSFATMKLLNRLIKQNLKAM